jgi:hypothetical protein
MAERQIVERHQACIFFSIVLDEQKKASGHPFVDPQPLECSDFTDRRKTFLLSRRWPSDGQFLAPSAGFMLAPLSKAAIKAAPA